jgi:hypothetical protein
MKLKLKLNKGGYNPGFILTAIFLTLLLIEVYFAYSSIYKNINVADPIVSDSNIVRVNLEQYNDTIRLLDQYETYDPGPPLITRNPFE